MNIRNRGSDINIRNRGSEMSGHEYPKEKVGHEGDFLRPPHKHLTPATVGINKVWWYDLPEAKDAIEEWKLQSWFYSDCSLTVMKGAILSTPPKTGLNGIQFSKTPNYISWSKKTRRYIYNCTKDEVRGGFLRSPHKHLTPATVGINKFWWYDLPEAKDIS